MSRSGSARWRPSPVTSRPYCAGRPDRRPKRRPAAPQPLNGTRGPEFHQYSATAPPIAGDGVFLQREHPTGFLRRSRQRRLIERFQGVHTHHARGEIARLRDDGHVQRDPQQAAGDDQREVEPSRKVRARPSRNGSFPAGSIRSPARSRPPISTVPRCARSPPSRRQPRGRRSAPPPSCSAASARRPGPRWHGETCRANRTTTHHRRQ